MRGTSAHDPGVMRRLLAALALACVASSASPVRGATAPASAGNVLTATLRNGLRVVIVRNAIAPVVSTDMTYLVGSRDDPAGVPGMAHAQEHMLFRGTPDLSSSELGTVATALGGDFNAQTGETLTQYQFTVPAANLDAILRIESDRMRDVLDAQSGWDDERGAIEQEVARDDSTPGNDFFRDAQAIAFAGTPYAHDGVGTKAAFDRLRGTQLKAFYRRWYAPNNAVFVVAGDVDPARALAQIRARFGSIPERPIPARPPVRFKPLTRTVIRRASSLVYPLAAVGFRMPGVNSPDFVASYVLQGLLDAQRGPLRSLAADGEALDAEWVAMPYFAEGQLAFAVVALNPDASPATMAGRIEGRLRAYANGAIPRELFETTKRELIASQEFSRNSVTELASDWADTVALDREPSIAREQQLIAAVTLADVKRVAKRYLNTNAAIVGELTPSANASVAAPAAPATVGPENPLRARAPSFRLPAWASGLVRDVRVPPATVTPVRTKLPNGITLIVVPERISDSVFVYGRVKTNPALEEPSGKEGVASVLEATFGYGTAHEDRGAFQRDLDRLDAAVGAGSELRLQATSQSFVPALSLLARNELDPRFDDRTVELAKRRVAADLATTLGGSQHLAVRRTEERLLPAGDPTLREPTIQGIAALSLGDVRAYYEKAFRPDETTLVVVGAVTPGAARAAVERAFGGWRASGSPPRLELPPVPLNGPATVKLSLPVQQDDVTLEELLSVKRSDPQYYALQLGNAVLGGGSAGPEQSRLFRDLRQNSGLVYVVSSELDVGGTRSRLSIQYACAPANEARTEQVVDADIAAMQRHEVGSAELALTKASMVRRSLVAGGSLAAIGASLLDDATEGLPLDQTRIDGEHLLAIDAAAVRSAFAAYVRPQDFVRVIEGP